MWKGKGPKAKYVSPENRVQEENRRGRVAFKEVVSQIREDLRQADALLGVIYKKVKDKSEVDEDTRDWIYDTFLDKIYEIRAKVKRLAVSLQCQFDDAIEEAVDDVKKKCEALIAGSDFYWQQVDISTSLDSLKASIESYFSDIRRSLHEVGWNAAARIIVIDYAIEHRKRFVKARDELEKAKEAMESRDWEEITNHLRTAIDLAIKEKFGFRKIRFMQAFLDEAEKNGLPLPSFDSLYHYYNMGSGRLHSGSVNPPFEAIQAVRFVSGFVDQLDLIEMDQEKIDSFKKISKTVK
jgi:hypothetical protein